jgi:hypothetical protein
MPVHKVSTTTDALRVSVIVHRVVNSFWGTPGSGSDTGRGISTGRTGASNAPPVTGYGTASILSSAKPPQSGLSRFMRISRKVSPVTLGLAELSWAASPGPGNV